ncbi:MAG: carbon-nitrogen hydrolase family protein [Acidobacteria bacterium]|nr:carbon-nitrogen hydrolase family protein [Acidobacteriota bacterium]
MQHSIEPLPVALVQHPPVFLNLEKSLGRAETLVAEAAGQGARLVVFPETWLPGYPVWLDHAPHVARWDYPPAKALHQLLMENAVAIPGPAHDRLKALAAEQGIILVMGLHERRGGTLYNTMLLLPPDGSDGLIHRKLTPTYTERLIWGVGDGSTLAVLDTPWGAVGGLICWEHWLPLARAAMHARRETVHIAQWPAVHELHQLASRHYAFEGQCYVLAAGMALTLTDVLSGVRSLPAPPADVVELLASMVVPADGWLKSGGSAVIGPDSSYLVSPVYREAVILKANLDIAALTAGHLLLDTAGHYSRPDVFRLTVDTRPQAGVSFVKKSLHDE